MSKKCACGGYMNDWHSHASDCVVINSKGGKDYEKAGSSLANIRKLCDEIEKELEEEIPDNIGEIKELVGHIRSMTHYIREEK